MGIIDKNYKPHLNYQRFWSIVLIHQDAEYFLRHFCCSVIRYYSVVAWHAFCWRFPMKYRMISFLRCKRKNTIPEMLLLVSWLIGSSLGFWAERFYGGSIGSFFELLPCMIPDWSSILVSAILPLLLSACAVVLFRNIVCYWCCFLRSFFQSILISSICRYFGFGAPIMVYLLLFSALWGNVFLIWFWQRRLQGETDCIFPDCCLGIFVCLAIGVVDRLAIAPFLVDVINLS